LIIISVSENEDRLTQIIQTQNTRCRLLHYTLYTPVSKTNQRLVYRTNDSYYKYYYMIAQQAQPMSRCSILWC